MIAVIDVSGNNLSSLGNALKRLNYDYVLTHEASQIHSASHVILPGVGTARCGMNALQEFGLPEILRKLTQPVLGICLGMQLLVDYSEEDNVECLGIIPGSARLMTPKKTHHPVPHMGWNQLRWTQDSPLSQGISQDDYVYFVHSYAVDSDAHGLARCTYSEEFSAIINKNNVYGMQFHPEKSADVGMRLLKNFLSLEASC